MVWPQCNRSEFWSGWKVFVLLPVSTNKLLAQWRGSVSQWRSKRWSTRWRCQTRGRDSRMSTLICCESGMNHCQPATGWMIWNKRRSSVYVMREGSSSHTKLQTSWPRSNMWSWDSSWRSTGTPSCSTNQDDCRQQRYRYYKTSQTNTLQITVCMQGQGEKEIRRHGEGWVGLPQYQAVTS